MKKYLCTLAISICLFLIASPVSADYYSFYAGNVTECVSCGEAPPLEGVSVTIDGLTVETAPNGAYMFLIGSVPYGCHTLTFEKPGYTTVTVDNVCLSGYTFTDVCLSKE